MSVRSIYKLRSRPPTQIRIAACLLDTLQGSFVTLKMEFAS